MPSTNRLARQVFMVISDALMRPDLSMTNTLLLFLNVLLNISQLNRDLCCFLMPAHTKRAFTDRMFQYLGLTCVLMCQGFIANNIDIFIISLEQNTQKQQMGTCQGNNNTINADLPAEPTTTQMPGKLSRLSSNPFYDLDDKQINEYNILSKYQFHSKYKDQFLGDCSVIQEKSTGDLYLCKELKFSDEQEMKEQVAQLQSRQRNLTSENVIQIKQLITKSTDGFFGDLKKILIILDYPFMSFQREIANRIVNKISFSKQEVLNFLNSTVKGYAAIERAGLRTDKVRLKNIFVGIKNKQSVIKVAENSLIQPKSNFQYMIDDGPNKLNNRDIYLSPEEYLAWADDNQDYQAINRKSGVFSLGMCLLDVCIMDPSRQMYHYTEKQIDQVEIKNRIQIAGKKYGGSVQKILREMLQVDPSKRISFSDLEAQLPTLTRNTTDLSKMHLSVIPSQKSNFINNDNTSLRSSQMFKSVVSNANQGSRVFASRIKMDQSRMRQEQVLDITQHYTNGNKYFGQKKGNMKHGKGRYDLADGTYFDGEWTENKINGKGILYFKNGKPEYDGQWRNDLYNGWGTLYSQIGSWNKYEGEFRNGVKQGRGRMYFKDGSVYDGEFRGDKISGRGRKINANGQVIEKYWDTISPQLFS